MPLYRVLTTQKQLQPFRAIELGAYYQERDLEDWLELNPQVLVADEPLLIIGRAGKHARGHHRLTCA